ncbi:MAG: thioredoxin family protein [Marinifilaceae bacterium]
MENNTTPGQLQFMEFFATWCPHCQRMTAVMDQLEKERTDVAVKRFDVDATENDEIMKQYNIDAIPAYVILKQGQPVWRGTGELSVDDIKNKLDTYK